jgi:indolepyruvate ferredoxin oxidoreductase
MIIGAVASKVNITFKILFNDAVAMTGGQRHEGGLTVDMIARQVAAEGVTTIAVVTDEPNKYPAATDWPAGTSIRSRKDLDAVQRELAATEGTTVLIYDQTCASEKRRRRKRGEEPDPDARIFINTRVCEGCGDCGVKSNCIAIQPVETEFGRKRVVDQSSCNKDFSCIEGFCPAFVTVHGATPRKVEIMPVEAPAAMALPLPRIPRLTDRPYSILVTGVGGTGVITIGAIIGMAAHLEAKGCGIIDMAGLAQKGGAVFSNVKIAEKPEDIQAIRVAAGSADLVLGCDLIVSGSTKVLAAMRKDETGVLINSAEVYPGEITRDADFSLPFERIKRAIAQAGGGRTHFFDASRMATALLGHSIGANMMMLGFAWQQGLVPLEEASILRAIELNGEAVDLNKAAFAWGRRQAADPAAVEAVVAQRQSATSQLPATSLDEVIERRVSELKSYGGAASAQRYLALVSHAAAIERSKRPGETALTEAVARNFAKLIAIKDEYEVARLYSDGTFAEELAQTFEGDLKLEFHLAPPLLARKNAKGEPQKLTLGPWMMKGFKFLAALRGLRKMPFDVFGFTHERRTERALIRDYEVLLAEILAGLSYENYELAVALASLPERIRGYGHIKMQNLATAKAEEAQLLAQFRRGPDSVSLAAE